MHCKIWYSLVGKKQWSQENVIAMCNSKWQPTLNRQNKEHCEPKFYAISFTLDVLVICMEIVLQWMKVINYGRN